MLKIGLRTLPKSYSFIIPVDMLNVILCFDPWPLSSHSIVAVGYRVDALLNWIYSLDTITITPFSVVVLKSSACTAPLDTLVPRVPL